MMTEKEIDQQNQKAWEKRNSQTEEALHVVDKIYFEADQIDYMAGKAASLRTKAYCQNLLGGHGDALLHCNESLCIYQTLGDRLGLFEITNILGQIYWELSDYPTALSYIIEMVEYARQMDDVNREADALNNLSMVYVRLGELEKALVELNKALILFRKKGDSRGQFFVLNNIAMLHHMQGDSEKGLEQGFASLAVANEAGLEIIKVKVLDTLGEIYIGLGESENALIYLDRALTIAEANNMKRDKQASLAKIGRIHLLRNEAVDALPYFQSALNLALETESNREVFQSYQALSETYEALGEHETALKFHKLFYEVNQQVFNDSSDQMVKDLEVRHRTETVKREAELLRDKNEALNQLASELDEEVNRKTAELRASLHNEQALKRSLADALTQEKELGRLKTNIINTMSHEFRTPLNAIIGYSEILWEEISESEGEESENALDLARIQTAGRQLLQLIDNVLDLSAMEVKKGKLSLAFLEIDALLASILPLVEPIMVKRGNRFTFNNSLSTPRFVSDEIKLRQILINLLTNAAKFTENGEVDLSVYNQADELIVFEVRDSGIGIQPDNLDAIFESFWQAESSFSRNYEGSGLGLAISKGFAELLGGEIRVESEPGCGSIFTLILPLVPETADDIIAA